MYVFDYRYVHMNEQFDIIPICMYIYICVCVCDIHTKCGKFNVINHPEVLIIFMGGLFTI